MGGADIGVLNERVASGFLGKSRERKNAVGGLESVYLLVITKLPVGFFCRRPLLIYSSSVSLALSTVIENAAMV